MRKLIVAASFTIVAVLVPAHAVSAHQSDSVGPAPSRDERAVTVSDFLVPALPLAAGATGYAVSMALERAGNRRRQP